MAKTKQEIIDDILNHIHKNSTDSDYWYVGITKDIEERLFTFHNVTSCYIYRQAPSSKIAREIETYFLELGADGGSGGGDDDSSFVYAYKITNNTKEREE